MCDYRLDFRGLITLEDYSSIDDYMELINTNDNLTITITEKNKLELEIFKSMLRNKNFLIYEKIKNNDGSYSIKVCKGK
ncbi:hypothetical protein SAMN02745134_03707 [Clostridium acidisoli DSM 12555]|uniref:Uncharacterized protein n=1 Tax=Clostridium acidisoli DSM 12555 TaxID=1121291 RepID=A0A1W1XZH0_9CLOT|nr:hypothetical protein [Clostridium acidisoli]SMC28921.1 hypothetical protein SAMN02745134_03707 [Clostridium acidisoli DSM 12555]